ncbi:MAG: DNA recombination protein RmuC [Candidatus Saccharimonadales bacterium]
MNQEVVLILIVLLGFGALFLGLRGVMQKLLLQLHEKNEAQRSQSREETDSSVRGLLDDNRKQLDLMIGQLKEQLKSSQTEVRALKEQNAGIRQHLQQSTELTEKLRVSTEGLQSLLSNNRLRGEWGEQVAEDLLLAAGFVEGHNYQKQSTTAEGRPDFTVLLPDGFKVNIDAKFPFDDLVRYQEAENDSQRAKALKAFETSVKTKVKEVTSKDYIDPSNQTVDFVVMFIPNEMIFSFIYEKVPGIVSYASDRKVMLTGPFGFTALLRLVLQAHKNFHYEKELQEIVGLIEQFQRQYEMFGESLSKVGRSLDTAQKAFHDTEGLRQRQLTRVVDKITEQTSDAKLLPEKGSDE